MVTDDNGDNPEPKTPNRLQTLADWLDGLHVIRITAAVGFPIALIAFGIDLYFRYHERQIAAEERVAREEARMGLAWQMLTSKTGGSFGKVWAVEFLIGQGHKLQYLDLSPDNDVNRTVLRFLKAPDVDFQKADFERIEVLGADFRRANFVDSNLKGAEISLANFTGAFLVGTDFRGANLELNNFQSANFIGTKFRDASISFSNLSGADFTVAQIEGIRLTNNWAWADDLPKGLKKDLGKNVLKCDPKSRPKYENLASSVRGLPRSPKKAVDQSYIQVEVIYFDGPRGRHATVRFPPDNCSL